MYHHSQITILEIASEDVNEIFQTDIAQKILDY